MIVLYQGARGRGKTLTMVKDAYKFFCKGWKVYSNINLSFGESITNDEIMLLGKDSDIYDAVMVIDEIQVFFDSRASSNVQNKRFSNFIQQSRKRNVHILCTAQFTNTVEKRLRQHLDVVVFPEFKKPFFCKVTRLDISSLEDSSIFVEPKDPRYFTFIYDARRFFKMYDTNELVL